MNLVDQLNAELDRLEAIGPKPTRSMFCELRISARCNNENTETWHGQACCPFCYDQKKRGGVDRGF